MFWFQLVGVVLVAMCAWVLGFLQGVWVSIEERDLARTHGPQV